METRTRYTVHSPTTEMLADGLTKTGTFLGLLAFCTTGVWTVKASAQIRARRREPLMEYTEADLEKIDW